MYILGISCFYHDSSASLIKDGKVLAAAGEERFTREKNYSGFPLQAINYCLKEGNITVNDVSYIAFSEKPFLKFQRVVYDYIDSFPFSIGNFFRTMPQWLDQRLIMPVMVKKELGYKGEVCFVKHHLAHAASSFFVSGFNESCIITADAVGEWESVVLSKGKENRIESLECLHYPDSLGILYSALTTFLGFKANSDEGKVMALGDYGSPSFLEEFKKIITTKDDGSFALNKKLIDPARGRRMYRRKEMEKILGSARKPSQELEQRHFDIAATLQKITEDTLIKIANYAHSGTGGKNLCLAGGIFLNCVANRKIQKKTPFKNIFIQPSAGDGGASLGAALYADSLKREGAKYGKMKHSYLGPAYSNKKALKILSYYGFKPEEYEDEDALAEFIARRIWDNNILALFRGRMEWGPRALGARSILANPANPEMKEILNKRVKHREWFRPFGLSILEDDCSDFFNIKHSPFMLFADSAKPDKKDLIPAGVHINGTSRIQTVNKEDNPFFYKIISHFKKISGVPAVINTSFNDKGEPIVCSPADAVECFINTEIDTLILENNVIRKAGSSFGSSK
jgi:carbamoyltransferase